MFILTCRYDCSTPWYMGPSIHPRLKRPVGQRLALGALAHAYGHGGGSAGGTISGCRYKEGKSHDTLTLTFKMPAGRELRVRKYNTSNVALSATSVLVNGSWRGVHISLATSPAPAGYAAIVATLEHRANGTAAPATAVRYAWGATVGTSDEGGFPNGGDISCCEGDGDSAPCLMAQCPLLAAEPLAPFGGLPVDPFVARIVAGKCLCPAPQKCDDA